jgi:hypothetical protein
MPRKSKNQIKKPNDTKKPNDKKKTEQIQNTKECILDLKNGYSVKFTVSSPNTDLKDFKPEQAFEKIIVNFD